MEGIKKEKNGPKEHKISQNQQQFPQYKLPEL